MRDSISIITIFLEAFNELKIISDRVIATGDFRISRLAISIIKGYRVKLRCLMAV